MVVLPMLGVYVPTLVLVLCSVLTTLLSVQAEEIDIVRLSVPLPEPVAEPWREDKIRAEIRIKRTPARRTLRKK